MTMLATSTKKWTYQEYAQLDDGHLYELFQGELEMSPAPNVTHQEICRDLTFLMWHYVRDNKLGKVLLSPLDVILDNENTIQPDIIYVSDNQKEIIQERGIFGSPDLVVEILSPSSVYKDHYEKKALYERFKVKEYWLVDPRYSTISVFTLVNDRYELLIFATEKGTVHSKVIDGFEIELNQIFQL